jgi:hypothetical protein
LATPVKGCALTRVASLRPHPFSGLQSAGDRVRIHQCIDQTNPQLSFTRAASAQFPIYPELQQNHDVRGDICHA